MQALTNERRGLKAARRAAATREVSGGLRRSRILSRGGFDVYEGLLDERFRRQMLVEAVALYCESSECDVPVSDGEEVRGGTPARRFRNRGGGPVQDAFYRAPWVIDFLRGHTDSSPVPTGRRGTYSYYARA